MKSRSFNTLSSLIGTLIILFLTPFAHGSLFNDNEARQAILDIRSQLENVRVRVDALTHNTYELNNQNQQLQHDLATERGHNENICNQLKILEQNQKNFYEDLNNRLRKFEPERVMLNGIVGIVQPGEKDAFDKALNQFRNSNFKAAANSFQSFINHYPKSPYQPEAQFWLGNSQYALKNYKGSNATLHRIVRRYPTHPKAAEALLAIANNQLESGQKDSAKKTLELMIKIYPDTESAQVAKERATKLR
ncbi:tol-pal system protein YbgF [Candidatus Pandoraea novymonadis]|uniref:Cell division coordinator CpoB n=1 Tax=Candidatus Pandoraea novymonadis TaxID=1808959 RepID=A0ABX5FHD9_9BURK|nr:tol-pal system protein YbgF [Candidatus Pandoraea novymonadis]PSB92282.1 Outer membrane protein assembly factor BamD [Candidatus Pandoraea novymonadis]